MKVLLVLSVLAYNSPLQVVQIPQENMDICKNNAEFYNKRSVVTRIYDYPKYKTSGSNYDYETRTVQIAYDATCVLLEDNKRKRK